jgi:hypothetical protein
MLAVAPPELPGRYRNNPNPSEEATAASSRPEGPAGTHSSAGTVYRALFERGTPARSCLRN